MKKLKIALLSSVISLALSGCITTSVEIENKQSVTTSAQVTLVDGKYKVDSSIRSFVAYLLVETQMGDIAPRVVSLDQMADDLVNYDVVFFGEAHGHTANHYVQSQLFSELYQRNEKMSLSMEQFERSQQGIVDQYLSGEIGEQMLRDEGKAWDHYASSYRPMVELAKRNGLPVIAAEVPGNMVSCVGEEGASFLERLEGEPRTWIADKLHLQDGPYKERYLGFLAKNAGHSVVDPNMSETEKELKRFLRFAAQVSRDDTMAMSIHDHLKANPDRKVMHINGSFHSAALLGTVERLKIRNPKLKLANIHPILVKDAKNPEFDASLVGEGQYLLLIQSTPKRFVQMKNISAFVKRTKKSIDKNRCSF